ncbi:NAD(P)/FAD-dependent oxidoreductase, partial [Tsukamurella pulmonis]
MTAIAESTQGVATGPQERIEAWLARFEEALVARDVAAAADLFEPDGFWRDLVSFTWNLHTSEGRDQIAAMLTERLGDTAPSGFVTTDPATGDEVAEAFLGFETGVGRGKGHLRIRRGDDGVDRAWTLLTTLRELKGHEESFGVNRPMGAVHGAHNDAPTWAERRELEEAELGRSIQPDTLVIGGGQGGIALGARLR